MLRKMIQILFFSFSIFIMGCSFLTSSDSKDGDTKDLVPDETCTVDDAENPEGNCDDEATDENLLKFN